MTIRRYLYQFRRYSDTIADSQNRALDYSIDAKFARDLRQRFARAFVRHGCGTRNHTQRPDFCQVGNQVIGHAIGEIFLVFVAGKILERQHDQGLVSRWNNLVATEGAVMNQGYAEYDRRNQYCNGETR